MDQRGIGFARSSVGGIAAMLLASSSAGAQVSESAAAATSAGVPAALSEDGELVTDPGSARWAIRFEPSAWFMSPAGKLRLPGTTTNGSQVDLVELGLDHPKVYPFGELHFVRDRWRITLSGAWLDDEATATATESGSLGDAAYSAGDSVATDFSFASFQALAAVRVYEFQGEADEQGRVDFAAMVELTGGVRLYAIDIDVQVAASPGGMVLARTSASEFFAEPVVGVKTTVVLLEEFTIDSELTIGGFMYGDTSVFSVDVIVGGTWHPTRNFGVQIGYRQLAYFLTSGNEPGEFEYNGTLAGLYGGLDLRF